MMKIGKNMFKSAAPPQSPLTVRIHIGKEEHPGEHRGQDVHPLPFFLKQARKAGFDTALLLPDQGADYAEMLSAAQKAKALGYQVGIHTNGAALNSRACQEIFSHIHFVRLRLEGAPSLHNEMNGDPQAFDRLVSAVDALQKREIAFDFCHTLTAKSWDSLLWFGEFAHEMGARALLIQPLAHCDDDSVEHRDQELDQITLHKVFFLTNYLQNKYKEDLEVHLAVFHKNYIEKNPFIAGVYPKTERYENEPFTSIVKTITINSQGDVKPLSCQFGDRFLIANIHYLDPKENIFQSFMQLHGKELKSLFMQCYWKMVNSKEASFYNVEEFMAIESQKMEAVEMVR